MLVPTAKHLQFLLDLNHLFSLRPPTITTYMGKQAFAAYEVQPLQGVDDFLSIPLGTGVSFSYDFTILQAGQTGSNVQTETITVPGSEQTIRMGRNSQTTTIQIPEETMTIPINVPHGLGASNVTRRF